MHSSKALVSLCLRLGRRCRNIALPGGREGRGEQGDGDAELMTINSSHYTVYDQL